MKDLTLLIKPASGRCNYDCAYCFYKDELKRRAVPDLPVMSYETLDVLVRKAFAAAEDRVNFMFQGGEPMLMGIDFYKKLMELEVKYSKGKKFTNSIQTNGSLIDDDWAKFFAKEDFLVGLSLDGISAVHDSFRLDRSGMGTWRATVDRTTILDKYHVNFNVLCVLTWINTKIPEETYEFLKKFNFIQFIQCLDPMDSNERMFAPSVEEFAKFLDKTFELYKNDWLNKTPVSIRNFDNYVRLFLGMPYESCAMRGTCSVSFTIESDGSVYPCDFYCLDEWLLGNVHDTSFIAMEKSPRAKDFISESMIKSKECYTCKCAKLCRGGCKRERVNGLNRYCEAYKAFFEEHYDDLIELAKFYIANAGEVFMKRSNGI